MKTKEEIETNLKAKIGGYLAGYGGSHIIEHIRMLDWVLNDGFIREIEDIVNEYSKKRK